MLFAQYFSKTKLKKLDYLVCSVFIRKTSCLYDAIRMIVEFREKIYIKLNNATVVFMCVQMCDVHIRMNINLYTVLLL